MTTVSGGHGTGTQYTALFAFVTAIESNLLSASDAMQFPLDVLVANPLSARHVMSRPVFTRIKCTKYDAGAVANGKKKLNINEIRAWIWL